MKRISARNSSNYHNVLHDNNEEQDKEACELIFPPIAHFKESSK